MNQLSIRQTTLLSTLEERGILVEPEKLLALETSRNKVLQEQGRIEFGDGVLLGIIEAFSESDYIQPREWVETMSDLYGIFHYIKNELDDDIGDDELWEWMAKTFEEACHGDVNLLAGLYAEKLIALYHRGEILEEKDVYHFDERDADEKEAEDDDY